MIKTEKFSEQFTELFIFETTKYLDELDSILLANEKTERLPAEEISTIFRIMHTIKGTAATMGYNTISKLAHKAEDLFSKIRDNNSVQDGRESELFDLLFSLVEEFRSDLEKEADAAPSEKFDSLTGRIKKYISDKCAPTSSVRIYLDPSCIMENVRAYIIVTQLQTVCKELVSEPSDLENDTEACSLIRKKGFVVTFPASYLPAVKEKLSDLLYIDRTEEVIPPEETERTEEKETSQSTPPPAAQTAQNEKKSAKSSENIINVHLSKLDRLQNLTSELVIAEAIAESTLCACPDVTEQARAAEARLKKLTDELRGVIMSIRMVPLSNFFQKMHKVVHDTAKKLNKEVAFESYGTETEVDKSIIDTISDTLAHIVRNAVTHGIESREERTAAGKDPCGKVTLSAKNTGSGIVITVSDDGRGISAEKAIEAARKKGIAVKETYTQSDILSLIMMPGVTTSDKVDECSGRGVGLDAVRAAVEKMRGTVTLDSEEGRGSNFFIHIPQTLAIMDCIGLEASGTTFMLPSPDVYRIVVPDEKELITSPDGTEKLLFDGFAIPLVRLDLLYGLPKSSKPFERGIIAVVEGETSAVAIYADKLMGQYSTVIKPLPELLHRLKIEQIGISGCTTLGDGSMSLVIDADVILSISREVRSVAG